MADQAFAGLEDNMLKVRTALAADAQSIGNLAEQFSRYLRQLSDLTDFNLTAETYLRLGFASRPAFAGLVAEDNGSVIGYLLYHFGFDSDAAARNLHIVDLYVDLSARRRGAGKALMARAAAIAREEGAEELTWSVYHANTLATKFYEKLGSQRITDVFFMKLPASAI
jgi:ribosomal protein S18 acetylase RimI-like enzyme